MGVYRVEVCPNNRAGCATKPCKQAGLKIPKGELRYAIQVTIKEFQSWQYRHWGCVTPKQIGNLIETCGGETDLVDGYDELPADFQEKIKFALENSHVPDEDWKGDPELNRPGSKKQVQKKKTTEEDTEDESASEKIKKTKNKAAQKDADDEDVADEKPRKNKRGVKTETGETNETPVLKKKRGRPAKKAVVEDDGDVENKAGLALRRAKSKKTTTNEVMEKEESDVEDAPPPKKVKAKKAAAKAKEGIENSEADEEVSKPKRGRKKASVTKGEEHTSSKKRGRKKAVVADE